MAERKTKKPPKAKPDYSDPKVRREIRQSGAWKEPFLDAIRAGELPSKAARDAHVDAREVYHQAKKDPKFKAAWDEAKDYFTRMVLEPTAVRLATFGVRRKKFTAQGDPVIDPETGDQYAEDDVPTSLLMFMLKGLVPEVYGDKSKVDLTSNGKPIIQVVYRDRKNPAGDDDDDVPN
jgi:hypothetical protein